MSEWHRNRDKDFLGNASPYTKDTSIPPPATNSDVPRDWVTLIDFSALRKAEGKVAVIDSALEAPSAYQPAWGTEGDQTPTSDSAEETNIDLDTLPTNGRPELDFYSTPLSVPRKISFPFD
eukprot:Gregarina_sp_Pseudo_9__3712@NODE_3861_length_541_cov_4_731076_g3200_i1_p1_GENE_NODE_3861_length_541_cov_4_731076_g3200_i1NODE_3861_length_541_cov_4_731076_g3200_i1_p1_ORF_typecomplete_len121_score11_61_NODE_3861_length_541_cov_4_731076_g3200_i176438